MSPIHRPSAPRRPLGVPQPPRTPGPSEPSDFSRVPHHRGRGAVGEDAAVAWLTAQGFATIERNVTNHCGEIDLVAREGETLVFVEIKARSTDAYGPAIAAVPRSKQRRLARAAGLYLATHPWDGPCRFDVLGLDAAPSGGWTYTLIRDAFPGG
ncbi:MAG TPA: YraN family protein [Thermoanaerobaculia bacterium]|nr:YraN family protein [Thermoanaerobaculia bacterium]